MRKQGRGDLQFPLNLFWKSGAVIVIAKHLLIINCLRTKALALENFMLGRYPSLGSAARVEIPSSENSSNPFGDFFSGCIE